MNDIFSIEDCLRALGSIKPFLDESYYDKNDCIVTLTEQGFYSFEKLRNLLFYLEKEGIISSFNEDKLDKYVDSFGRYY